MSVWSRYGKDAVIMPSELKGGKTLEEQFANPIARGVITPTKTKEVEQVTKRKTYGQEYVVKVATFYNRTGASINQMASEFDISPSSIHRLKQKAVEQGLIQERPQKPSVKASFTLDDIAEAYNRGDKIKDICSQFDIGSRSTLYNLINECKAKGLIIKLRSEEDEPVNVIKKEQAEMIGDITKEVPEPTDADTLMLEFDCVAVKAGRLQEITAKHRQAALDVFKALGKERSVPVLQVLYEQLDLEVKSVFAEKAV